MKPIGTMAKPLKTIGLAAGALVALLVLAVVVASGFLDIDDYKPRIEAAASKILGMEVRVGGRMGIGFHPELRITLEDVRIRNRGTDVVTAKQAMLGISLLGLFRNEVRINGIVLEQPVISIEKTRDGKFNFEKPEIAREARPDLNLKNVSISGGVFTYADRLTGGGFKARDCRLNATDLLLSNRRRPDIMKNLSFTAELACGEISTRHYAASDLKFSAAGQHGIFNVKLLAMRAFAGQGSGDILADHTGAVPHYQVRYSLSRFHIDAFLKALSQKNVGTGLMDFSAELSMQGKTMDKLKRTATGNISLRGRNLVLHGRDLDKEFARFEASQNFSLVDAGAFLFAGPVGLAVTKGYDFASVVRGSEGRSEIPALVSDWKIGHGVARARDVALATNKNRVAFRGGLDFVNRKFDDVSVALLDTQGCAKVKQRILGTFKNPVTEKPDVIAALAGPVRSLFKQAESIFPGERCEVFYAGSVAPP